MPVAWRAGGAVEWRGRVVHSAWRAGVHSAWRAGVPAAWRAAALAVWLLVPPVCVPSFARAFAADTTQTEGPVTLSVNPDGTVVWNGEHLPNKPALENRLVRRAQESPKLELDVQFQSNGFQTDSNRKTLTDLLELTARFGYVHIVNSADGVRLIVLSPTAGDAGR